MSHDYLSFLESQQSQLNGFVVETMPVVEETTYLGYCSKASSTAS